MSLSAFVEHKLSVAEALNAGTAGGSYADACVIMSAAVSAIASLLWPKAKGKDKKRFVEVWFRYADGNLSPNRISLPLLIAHLQETGRTSEASALARGRRALLPGEEDLVVTGDDVDATEAEVLDACPSLSLFHVRKYAYPSLFYREVRCSLAHEYQLGPSMDSTPMTINFAGVSYTNVLLEVDPLRSERRVHFHLPWLFDVARSIAASVETVEDGGIPEPTAWWCDGQET